MCNYQIGQDIQSLRIRVEALERKHKSNSRPLREHELSDTQKKNLQLLRQHSRAIVSEMNRVLRQHGVNLYVASFPVLTPDDLAERTIFAKAGPCCCAIDDGHSAYVSDCDDCYNLPVGGNPPPVEGYPFDDIPL